MPARPWSRPALGLAVACMLGACASPASDDGTTGPTGGAATFQGAVALACTDVLNERPAEFATGQEAMLDVIVVLQGGEAVDADEVDIEAVRAAADEMDRTAERLAEVDTGEATATESAAWEEILGAVDERATHYDNRLAALESGDPDEIAAGFERISPPAVPEEALADLGLAALGTMHRDCAELLDGPGAAGDAFHAEAATACAVALQAERDGGATEDRETMIDILLALRTDTADEVTDADREAVSRLATTTRTTADQLADVDSDNDRADDWGTFVAAADERAATVERRAEALNDGSDADIAEAFTPDADDTRGQGAAEALERLGLFQRECTLLLMVG